MAAKAVLIFLGIFALYFLPEVPGSTNGIQFSSHWAFALSIFGAINLIHH
jgi:hypothetical protein